MFTRATNFLRTFREDTRGSVTVEAILILPMLFWIYLSIFSIFDAFRQYSLNQKAAFTIADLLSRETAPINANYLTNMQTLLDYIVTGNDDSDLRVTVITYDAEDDDFEVLWSKKKGARPELTTSDVQNWHQRLPVMPDGELIVVTETWNYYDPPFNTGLEERVIHNFVFTRPRYAPQLLWSNDNSGGSVGSGS
jgi:hypothetical protein